LKRQKVKGPLKKEERDFGHTGSGFAVSAPPKKTDCGAWEAMCGQRTRVHLDPDANEPLFSIYPPKNEWPTALKKGRRRQDWMLDNAGGR
jgi:hypothetical protein